jgi:hypothetical protein
MVGMQMGAEHDVDVFWHGTGLAQACQIGRVALVESR